MKISGVYNLLWGFVKNPYPGPGKEWLKYHIPGKEVKDKGNIKREDKQHFFPKENKTSSHLLALSDFVGGVTEELKKIFHERWFQELFGKKAEEKFDEYCDVLTKNGIDGEKVEAIFDYEKENIKRIKNWSHDNEIVGGRASNLMSFAIPLGIIRNLISGIEAVPNSIQRAVSFFYAFCSSMRGYYQYSDRVYNRPDDEVAMNKYQAEVYGNKVAGSLGTSACFMETKVNPLILPAISLFSSNKHTYDNVFSLSIIPNLSWWRGRMLAHINQEYLTDLLKFLLHKPLSLLGIKSSKEVIEEIKERRNLEPSYVAKRHYENLGIKDPNKQSIFNFVSELVKSVKNSIVGKDTKIKQESARKAGETIAPLFGFTAFIATALGTPLRLFFKVIDKQNRLTDFFSSLSLSCQQCIYFFKMVVPALCNIKKTKNTLLESDLDKRLSKSEINDLKTLLVKYKKLSLIGILTFLSSIVNSTLKLFRFENPNLEKLKGTTEGLAGDLVSKFFSERRHTLGFQFRAENPEFYEEEVYENDEKKSENQVVIKHLKPELVS